MRHIESTFLRLAVRRVLTLLACALPPIVAAAASNAPQVTLTIFSAGTLANPFRQIDAAFMREHPNVTIQAQFGGSVKMAKQVTELHQQADIVAAADYSVIPKYLFTAQDGRHYTDWYVGFATNAITFVYTPRSKYASEISPKNWYSILAKPGVEIGRSNPDTDPSGYQTVQMLHLAERYYRHPGLADAVLANAPRTNMRDTETTLIAALQSGQIDYLAIYRSDARQHHFKYLKLPPQIDLGDARYSANYAKTTITTANGALTAKPIVYAATIPDNAPHRAWALKYMEFLLGKTGQKTMVANGFGSLGPAYASDMHKVPAQLKHLLVAWPAH
jgi:molybdate/tungstate transport system substrate-binding protein